MGAWQYIACLVMGIFLSVPAIALGDGGQFRVTEQRGSWYITVFTSPSPMRAGPVDVSVLIIDVASGSLAVNADVMIKLWRRDDPEVPRWEAATHSAATNKLYYAAKFALPSGGLWSVQVIAASSEMEEPATVEFDMAVLEPVSYGRSWWTTFVWPVVVTLLFAIHRALVAHRALLASPRACRAP